MGSSAGRYLKREVVAGRRSSVEFEVEASRGGPAILSKVGWLCSVMQATATRLLCL